MKVSRTGLSLLAIYVALSLVSWGYAGLLHGDDGSFFIAAALPILPAVVVMWSTHSMTLVNYLLNWLVIPAAFTGTSLAVYSLGWLAGNVIGQGRGRSRR